MTKHTGYRLAFRNLHIWMLLLTFTLSIVLIVVIPNKKANYTELHRRVTELERRLDERS